jgi:hypothetical protein
MTEWQLRNFEKNDEISDSDQFLSHTGASDSKHPKDLRVPYPRSYLLLQ